MCARPHGEILAAALLVAGSLACGRERVRVLQIEGRPSAVVVAERRVWVADDGANTVRVLDPSSGRQIGRPILVARSPIALASGGGAVWVGHASGVVVRIDARSRAVGPRIEAGRSITGIAVSADRVWAADLRGNALVEIDPSSGQVGRRIALEHGAVRVVVAGDALWVTNRENTVTRVEASSGVVGPSVRIGMSPVGLAYDGERVWTANGDGTVSRLRAATREPAARTTPACGGPIAVAVSEGTVWVACQDDRALVSIDATGELGDVVDAGTRTRGIAVGAGAIWVVGTEPGALVRIAV